MVHLLRCKRLNDVFANEKAYLLSDTASVNIDAVWSW